MATAYESGNAVIDAPSTGATLNIQNILLQAILDNRDPTRDIQVG